MLGSGVQHAILSNVCESFDWELLPETRDAHVEKIDGVDCPEDAVESAVDKCKRRGMLTSSVQANSPLQSDANQTHWVRIARKVSDSAAHSFRQQNRQIVWLQEQEELADCC